MTSKYFANEATFMKLAKENKKIFKDNGQIVILNPFAERTKRREEKEQAKTEESLEKKENIEKSIDSIS